MSSAAQLPNSNELAMDRTWLAHERTYSLGFEMEAKPGEDSTSSIVNKCHRKGG